MNKNLLLGLGACVLSFGVCAMQQERITYSEKTGYRFAQLHSADGMCLASVKFYKNGRIKTSGDCDSIHKIIRAELPQKEAAS